MSVSYEYFVMEDYPGECREPFGHEVVDHAVVVGERLTLHWLDGSVAYDVTVTEVHGFDITVRHDLRTAESSGGPATDGVHSG